MFADTFDEATRPYQFALQTRAGTDALSGMLRAAVDLDSAATIVSLDGRSAYDTISRTAFLRKLHAVAPALIPFVRLWYGQQSTYFWWDQDGQRRTIHQGEGCEQGDALAPALYALGQHDTLVAADEQLRPGECLAAFLDDVYLVTTPSRAREALDVVTSSIETRAGVTANLGKTRVYNRDGGPAPPGIVELGANVWCGDAPEAERGFVALGTPLGHPQFVAAHTDTRLLDEVRLLQELPLLPDLQCAWLLLAMCASPRADHLLRTLPPSLSASYARGHDDAVWRCLLALLGEEGDADPEVAAARRLALLPARLGGLGLQCAVRTAPAAYWAAWADALPVLRARRPDAAARCLAELAAGPAAAAACLLSRDRAVTYFAAPCPGHAAIAVWAARSCMARCHPERGWLRSAARPHANGFAAAAAAAFACRSTQVWRTRARLWRRCRRLWRPPRSMPSNRTARPPSKAPRACMGAHRA